ncbi:MAG: NAD(P)H-dependent glycerol-3-phosphate dehydrogenase [Candidatus Omnitrophota bacterium]
MQKQVKKICVLGDGGWGTALAIMLSNKNYDVTIWGAFPDYLDYLRKNRNNIRYLPQIKIPTKIKFNSDINESVKNSEIIILAIPSQFMRKVIKKIKTACLKEKVFVSLTKGIENKSLKRMSEVIFEELGSINLAVLSGPTIADEVAKQIPTTAVIASSNKKLSKLLQEVFMTKFFRIYTSSDIIGVELGGSLKNIIAIACGISDGLGFGTNTKAAILSRGLAEIIRLGKKLGAKEETFSGLTGLGDLVTTCINPKSRNHYVGEEIGKGKSLKTILKNFKMVAEGVPTAKSAYILSNKFNVEMPISEQVYLVLYKNKSPKQAVFDLMTRAKKHETA